MQRKNKDGLAILGIAYFVNIEPAYQFMLKYGVVESSCWTCLNVVSIFELASYVLFLYSLLIFYGLVRSPLKEAV